VSHVLLGLNQSPSDSATIGSDSPAELFIQAESEKIARKAEKQEKWDTGSKA